ncbi:MAG: protein kinase, partial [bacterium]
MAELVGKTISHYKILEKLGAGGMGTVYKAEDTKLDRFIALKFLPQHLSQDEENKKRFIHEAKAASALNHPNIATIYEIDEADGQMFIAMEYIEGKSLLDMVHTPLSPPSRGELKGGVSRPLPLDDAIDCAIQIVEGLQAAHEKGIIHRDIKPANIIITEKGVAKIVDFGLAKLAGATQLTKEGASMGTVAYMSPEQAQGAPVDHRTDLWALGSVLYEMVAGQQPFAGDYEQAMMYSIMNEDPEPLTALRTGVPMELERIVSKALEKDKKDRYQHVDEMLTDLRKIERELKDEIKEKKLLPKRRWVASPLLWTGIALLLALFIGTLIFLPGESISFENRDWVLIADFDNTTENDVFSGALEEALERELSRSRYVNVVPPERKFDALRLMKKNPETHLDAALAREVALRDGGIRAILGGSIRQIGETFAITAYLINPKSGTRVIGLSEDARGMNDILTAIRRLSDRVR